MSSLSKIFDEFWHVVTLGRGSLLWGNAATTVRTALEGVESLPRAAGSVSAIFTARNSLQTAETSFTGWWGLSRKSLF